MKKLFFYGICTVITASLCAQEDSSGKTLAIDAHNTSLEQASNILNGKVHITYPVSFAGSGYTINEWSPGKVTYENIQYRNVQLKYDEFKDELVLLHPNGLAIILFTPRVHSFEIAGRKFINLSQTASPSSATQEGYYEQLLQGRIVILAKRRKTVEEKLQATGITKSFVGTNEYFALKEGKMYKIRKESALFDLMPEKKQAAKNILKDANINFNNDPESALLLVAEYYNQSSN